MASTCEKNVTDWPTTLREFRARHGLTQKQLAERFGTSLRAVQGWEGGEAQPPDFLLLALKWLDVKKIRPRQTRADG
jgi:DNA-binding transcriptional regulator YiaG